MTCDCGAALTQCTSCAVADWQAAHPNCRECCPVPDRADPRNAELARLRELLNETSATLTLMADEDERGFGTTVARVSGLRRMADALSALSR